MYIEQEPYVRDLLESYMGNRFKLMLETLERYSSISSTNESPNTNTPNGTEFRQQS